MTKNKKSSCKVATPNPYLMFPLASGALNPQDQLLGGLGLLPQDGLGLTAEPLLFTVVPIIEHIKHL